METAQFKVEFTICGVEKRSKRRWILNSNLLGERVQELILNAESRNDDDATPNDTPTFDRQVTRMNYGTVLICSQITGTMHPLPDAARIKRLHLLKAPLKP